LNLAIAFGVDSFALVEGSEAPSFIFHPTKSVAVTLIPWLKVGCPVQRFPVTIQIWKSTVYQADCLWAWETWDRQVCCVPSSTKKQIPTFIAWVTATIESASFAFIQLVTMASVRASVHKNIHSPCVAICTMTLARLFPLVGQNCAYDRTITA